MVNFHSPPSVLIFTTALIITTCRRISQPKQHFASVFTIAAYTLCNVHYALRKINNLDGAVGPHSVHIQYTYTTRTPWIFVAFRVSLPTMPNPPPARCPGTRSIPCAGLAPSFGAISPVPKPPLFGILPTAKLTPLPFQGCLAKIPPEVFGIAGRLFLPWNTPAAPQPP